MIIPRATARRSSKPQIRKQLAMGVSRAQAIGNRPQSRELAAYLGR